MFSKTLFLAITIPYNLLMSGNISKFYNLRSIYLNSNMTLRLSDYFSIFGLVFFVLKFLLGIARQWSGKKIQL